MLGVVQQSAEYSEAELAARGMDPHGDCTRTENPPDIGFVRWVKCLYARHERVVRVNDFETGTLLLCCAQAFPKVISLQLHALELAWSLWDAC